MDSDRIKEIQEETAYPQSISVYKALLKVWNECQQEHNEQLRLGDVVGRIEQLTCPRCNSTNILSPDKDNNAQCIECAFIWTGLIAYNALAKNRQG